MQLITFVAFIAIGSAAQLPNQYLPPNQGQGSQGQSYQGSFSSGGIGAGGSSNSGNTRAQQAIEKNAAILQQDQVVNENDFSYRYETSNGIRAEETNNGVQSQGGFSYQGDDGNTYSVTFTAGEGGFRAQGAHLPVAPPTPEDILAALEKNAKDEAAGIFDDGKYRPDANEGQSRPGQRAPGFGSSSSGQSSFGSANRQGSFNSNSGYNY